MSEESKHLPGPLTVTKARTLLHIHGAGPVCEISVSANHIHEDYPGCKRDYMERQAANAKLLAAAYTSYDKHCLNPIHAAEDDLLGEALDLLGEALDLLGSIATTLDNVDPGVYSDTLCSILSLLSKVKEADCG